MSRSEPQLGVILAESPLSDLASELSARLAEAADDGRMDILDDAQLARLFAAVIRLYATKAQAGETPPLFAGNHMVTATDVMIGCTAMLEATGLQAFELGQWQTWSQVGKRKRPSMADRGEEQ